MDPRKLFMDQRLVGHCAYCWGPSESADHVPSKVLLDEPYPENLPVVEACEKCNKGFSLDEEYVACLIECVTAGTTDPSKITRANISRILSTKPLFRAMMESVKSKNEGKVLWKPDESRVSNVITKLARGHVVYENAECSFRELVKMMIMPLNLMSESEKVSFETPPISTVFPEIGSRAFVETLVVDQQVFSDDGWRVLQKGRYRYCVSYSGSITVRMVLSEYLACEVIWK